MIKTIIFDLGKVIIDFDHSRIIEKIKTACPFSGGQISQMVFASEAVRNYETGKISSKEFFEQVKELLNLQMSFTEFAEAWNSTFELKPILPERLIEKLAQKYRLLILSDTNELHFEFIKANFPIIKYFDYYVLSYQVGAVKPSPQIFLAAIEKATCLPEECFFTDDREANVLGAKEFGINALQFFTAEHFENSIQDIIN